MSTPTPFRMTLYAVLFCWMATLLPTVSFADVIIESPSHLRVEVDWIDIKVMASDGPDLSVSFELADTKTGQPSATPWTDAHLNILRRNGDIIIHQSRDDAAPTGPPAKGQLSIRIPPRVEIYLDTQSGGVELVDLQSVKEISVMTATGQILTGRDSNLLSSYFSSASGPILVYGHTQTLITNSARGKVILSPSTPPKVCRIDSVAGDIEILRGCHHIKVTTTSGAIHGTELNGTVVFFSYSGEIIANWSQFNSGDGSSVQTVSSAITLGFPKGSAPGGEIETIGSQVLSVFPLAVDRRTPTKLHLLGKKGTLKVSSSGGVVTLMMAE